MNFLLHRGAKAVFNVCFVSLLERKVPFCGLLGLHRVYLNVVSIENLISPSLSLELTVSVGDWNSFPDRLVGLVVVSDCVLNFWVRFFHA